MWHFAIDMKNYYAYIHADPKDGTYRYVGKGSGNRALDHLNKKGTGKFSYLIKKRQREGYQPELTVIDCPSEKSAFAVEIFWIAVIGREDLARGPLFNLTNGGESGPGPKEKPWHKLADRTQAGLAKSGSPRVPVEYELDGPKVGPWSKDYWTCEKRAELSRKKIGAPRAPIREEAKKNMGGKIGSKHDVATLNKMSATAKGRRRLTRPDGTWGWTKDTLN